MNDNVRELRSKGGETEKITINLGLIDLGQIDLLVQEGCFARRRGQADGRAARPSAGSAAFQPRAAGGRTKGGGKACNPSVRARDHRRRCVSRTCSRHDRITHCAGRATRQPIGQGRFGRPNSLSRRTVEGRHA